VIIQTYKTPFSHQHNLQNHRDGSLIAACKTIYNSEASER